MSKFTVPNLVVLRQFEWRLVTQAKVKRSGRHDYLPCLSLTNSCMEIPKRGPSCTWCGNMYMNQQTFCFLLFYKIPNSSLNPKQLHVWWNSQIPKTRGGTCPFQSWILVATDFKECIVCSSFGHGLNKQLCQILHRKTNSVNSKGTAVSIKVLWRQTFCEKVCNVLNPLFMNQSNFLTLQFVSQPFQPNFYVSGPFW